MPLWWHFYKQGLTHYCLKLMVLFQYTWLPSTTRMEWWGSLLSTAGVAQTRYDTLHCNHLCSAILVEHFIVIISTKSSSLSLWNHHNLSVINASHHHHHHHHPFQGTMHCNIPGSRNWHPKAEFKIMNDISNYTTGFTAVLIRYCNLFYSHSTGVMLQFFRA